MHETFHFCTYFDRRYLLRGLTLYRSLCRHVPGMTLFAVCLDEFSLAAVGKIDRQDLIPVSLNEVEDGYSGLLSAKSNRKLIEYYFTLTPAVPLHLLKTRGLNLISYIDADVLFYSDAAPIFEEMGTRSILVIPHRFPPDLRHKEECGLFNVEFLSFRNDASGLACLERWRDQCIEWCYDRLEGNRFAEQKYIDEWPALYPSLAILGHKGAGLAPWNWMRYDIRFGDNDAPISVDGQPLIFYHFHGLKLLSERLAYTALGDYHSAMPAALKRRIYGEYIRSLSDTARWIRNAAGITPEWASSDRRYGTSALRTLFRGVRTGQLMRIGEFHSPGKTPASPQFKETSGVH